MARCPICHKTFSKKADILIHVESVHKEDLPNNMSTAQFVYSLNHNGRVSGICRYCHNLTPWNEKAGKPYQICGSKACKEKNKKIAEERMMRVYGKTNLLSDPKHQEKMLANRSISGTYLWSDGKHKFTYTGSYEKFAIEWLDKVFDIDPDTVQMPGPILEYEFKGEKKHWITDIYLTEFNLIIEVKDGKDENTHPGFRENREREEAKDLLMKNQKVFNYVKITHKNMMQLVAVLSKIRLNNITSTDEEEGNIHKKPDPTIVINESAKIRKESIQEKINELEALKAQHLAADDMPSFYFENLDSQIKKYRESLNEAVEALPLGKQRKTVVNNIELIKLLPNEAPGHTANLKHIINMIEMHPQLVHLASDIHIGRKNLNMTTDERLQDAIDRINAVTTQDSLVLLLGDIVTSKDTTFVKTYTTKLLNGLNCKKVVLVLGNNDHLSVKDYYDLGYYYVTDRIDTTKYLFSHYPEFVAGDKINVHGHLHLYHTLYNLRNDNHIDVYFGKPGEPRDVLSLTKYKLLYDSGFYKYMETIHRDY